jgi:IclR family mhp operon transcriptional activator
VKDFVTNIGFLPSPPAAGELLREVLWPTDISTLDVDAMVVRETTHRFSRLSFHRAMVGRRLRCC